MMANFDDLYALEDPLSSRFFRGAVLLPSDVNRNSFLTGNQRPLVPLRIGRAEGSVWADIVWTDNVAIVLLSERLAKAFQAAAFTGWSTYPVNLEVSEAAHKYFGLTVTGRCGPLDRSRGEWVRKDDEPGRFLRGLFFDEQSWDGSDFFLPGESLRIFVTERVRDCMERERIKNVRVNRLNDALTAEVVIRNTRA